MTFLEVRARSSYSLVLAGFILLVVCCGAASAAGIPQGGPTASVAAIEGEAKVFAESQEQPVILAPGVNVGAWSTITTGTQARLLLNWGSRLVTSMGDMSSLFVSVEDRPDGNVAQFQVIEGIVRVATAEGVGPVGPYAVLTPAAAIQPLDYSQPLDVIVESYDPTTTAVTVLAGQVRVSTGGEGGQGQKTLSACETAYVDQVKKTIEVAKISPGDVARLVSASTLAGTLGMHPGPCMVDAVPPPAEPAPPASAYYFPGQDYTYIEDSLPPDFAAFDDITVLPPRAGVGCSILVPGIGQFTIPYDVFGNWACDPIVVLPYARRVFFDRCLLRYQDYWRDLWWRRNELHRLMYLAQLCGNTPLLLQSRHELDYLNVRMHWADRRIRGLEGRVATLGEQEQRVQGRLPHGLNMHQAIADGLFAPANVHSLEKFQSRLKRDLEVQNRLTGVAAQQVVEMRSRLGHERDAQKRLMMRNGLVRFNGDVAEGKLPIPAKQREVSQLYGQLGKERDPGRQERLQGQLLEQLRRAETSPVPNVLDPTKLAPLQKELAQFPSAEKRGDLEKRFAEVQHAVASRREAEADRMHVEGIAAQAAQEKDPQKQQDMLRRLKDLSVPLAVGGLGAVGLQQLHRQQQSVQQQIGSETDQAKKAGLQKTLEGLQQRETGLQQLEQYRRGFGQAVKPGETEKKQQQLQPGTPGLQKQQQQDRRQLVPQSQPEQHRQGNQIDHLKQQEQLRLQRQDQDKKDTGLQRRQPEERLKKDEETARQQHLQQERVRQDELRKQQLQKEQENRRQEQLKQEERSRLEKTRNNEEQSRRQQLQRQQDQHRQQDLRLQQERSRQEQQRQQQEKSRQEQQRLQQERSHQEQQRLQQERSRQEQMKLQQERSQQQQLRQQQDRARQEQQRQQQEKSRQQAIRQQQEQARQQSIRQQQERARQDQLRHQKIKEEEEKKRR